MNQRAQTNSPFVNYARLETNRLPWPEYIADPEGDRERALRLSYRRTALWRTACLFTAAVLLCVLLLLVFKGAL
jgi:hypothetical protein